MIEIVRRLAVIGLFAAMAACSSNQTSSVSGAPAADPELDQDVQQSLANLYADTPQARDLAEKAKGILVFPDVVRVGFIFGGSHGKGELIENGRVTGHYRTTAVTWGLQAGAQKYGYVMMFMTASALEDLKQSANFDVGVGPTIVVVDKGAARDLTTTTIKSDIYAFVFGQKGLMAGVGLRGSKITRTD
jgi:lipid-binding SYLF domain-containing protein